MNKNKPKPTDPTPDELKALISAEDDFGHEMRVGNAFREVETTSKAGNNTHFETPEHGWSYKDANTGKPRQFDYRFRISCHGFLTPACAMFAAECKNIHPSSRLVLCGTNRTQEEAYHVFVRSNCNEVDGAQSFAARIAEKSQLYEAGKFVAKTCVRVKQGQVVNDSDVYDRWAQAVASSFALVREARFRATQRGKAYFSLILPVVVVPNGALWTLSYDSAGNMKEGPIQEDHCEYFIGIRETIDNYPFTFTHIHFATLIGFQKLLSKFAVLQDWYEWESRFFPAYSENLD